MPSTTAPIASSKPTILNRYTTIPILLDILYMKHLTLLSPETWEDRNDAYYLERYQQESKLRSVLAICFSLRRETFHHWRVFSSGSSGVCIEFDKERLLQCFADKKGFRYQAVDYHLIGELKKNRPQLKSWPFLKRAPFKDERKNRVIFESRTDEARSKSLPIHLQSISLITLSPWLPSTVGPAVTSAIRRIDDCAKIKVRPSSLINNADWKAAVASK